MSFVSFASTVDLRLRPSRRALQWALWLHALPAALLPLTVAPGWPMVAVAGLIALSWMAIRHHPALGLGRRAITRLTWDSEDRWQAWIGGKPQPVTLLGHSLVHGDWLVLRFETERGRCVTRLLMGDDAGAEPLRRLRARLSVLS